MSVVRLYELAHLSNTFNRVVKIIVEASASSGGLKDLCEVYSCVCVLGYICLYMSVSVWTVIQYESHLTGKLLEENAYTYCWII